VSAVMVRGGLSLSGMGVLFRKALLARRAARFKRASALI
jgi:hypothetical protein